MFQEKAQAFLALPLKKTATTDLAGPIGEALSEQGIEPVLATDISSAGAMADQILNAIRRAEVVVADLTGASPNVLFEVGMALGLSKPVLLLSQGPAKEMPLGLQTLQVAMYRPDDLTAVRRYVELWLRDVRARRQTAAY
jgi:hypothetical protein